MPARDDPTPVDECRRAFQRALAEGREIRLEEYLGGLEPGVSDELLPQLLAVEMAFRRRRGEEPHFTEYADRFGGHSEAVRQAFEDTDNSLFTSTWGGMPFDESEEHADIASTPTRSLMGPPPISGAGDSTTLRLLLDRYELREMVGRGGFGEVWRAFDRKLQKIVAVKLPRSDRPLRERQLEALLDEARRSTRLTHPGVVRVLDVCNDEGTCFIVSEFKDGGTLRRRLEAGPIDVVEASTIVAELADILHEAHLQDCVHRDVKPDNVLLDRRGRPYLVDFGLAASELELVQEREGLLGTVAYMSPEQASGHSNKVDARTDVYSLGVLMYRMLTGRMPFVATSPSEYLEQIVSREPRPPRTIDDTIPAELERVCLRCLRKDVSARYTTAADLSAELRMWLTEVASTSARPAWEVARDPLSSQRSTSTSLVVAIVAVVVALVAVVAIALRTFDRPAGVDPVATTTPRDFSAIPPEEIVLDRRYPLMAVAPQAVTGKQGFHNPTLESYHVPNGMPRLARLGEVDRATYTVSFQVVREGNSRTWGEFAFVFGLRPVGEGRSRGQAIVLMPNLGEDHEEYPLVAQRCVVLVADKVVQFEPTVDVEFWQMVPRQPMSVEVAETRQFEISVINSALSSVRWGGMELGALHTGTLNAHFTPHDHRGGLCLWTSGGGAMTFRGGAIIVESDD